MHDITGKTPSAPAPPRPPDRAGADADERRTAAERQHRETGLGRSGFGRSARCRCRSADVGHRHQLADRAARAPAATADPPGAARTDRPAGAEARQCSCARPSRGRWGSWEFTRAAPPRAPARAASSGSPDAESSTSGSGADNNTSSGAAACWGLVLAQPGRQRGGDLRLSRAPAQCVRSRPPGRRSAVGRRDRRGRRESSRRRRPQWVRPVRPFGRAAGRCPPGVCADTNTAPGSARRSWARVRSLAASILLTTNNSGAGAA